MSFSGENSGFFDDDGYVGYDARLASQRFDSFPDFDEVDSVADDGVFREESVKNTPLPVYGSAGGIGLNSFGSMAELDSEEAEVGGFGESVLPVRKEMQSEKGDALREWRRLNASQLAEKDKMEKEMRNETLLEAEEFKADFYRRRQVAFEKKKVLNRERQKIILENHEKFHKEAAANYWKAIAELVPKEVPAIANRGKKDKEKNKPSITIIQGPKPGKPTDLSRMQQIISKLKQHTPPHLMPTASSPTSDSNTVSPAVHAPPSKAIAAA